MAQSVLEVEGHRFAVTFREFKVTRTLLDGTEGVFYPPWESKYPFPKPLSDAQMQALWLITEGTVLSNLKPIPSWRIAELLKLPPSNISSRVTTPLEKKKLVRYENRPTSRPNSSHPRKEEKIWLLNSVKMQTTYDILATYFMDHNFNNLIWKEGPDVSTISEKNRIAEIRFMVLVYLKKKIDQYENSPEWCRDHGINPPPGNAAKKHKAISNP